VFFQGLLLCGYLYAHLSVTYLPHRVAVLIHGVLALMALMALPLGVTQAFGSPPEENQAFWLIAVFTTSVGLPFFVLSATAPLLQAWFARSGHEKAHNPYFLYVASNIGSFAALISYPLLIEPMLALQGQTTIWMWFFGVLIAGLVVCGLFAKAGFPALHTVKVDVTPDGVVTWRDRAVWTALASIPSGLLVAVTAHLSTDVASVPLLWVVPLALFLLTFIFAFNDKQVIRDAWVYKAWAWLSPFIVLSLAGYIMPLWLQFVVHLGGLFAASMICHRLIYQRKPATAKLTEFYLWMSFGGMIGGLFTGLMAPYLFDRIIEYRILLIAALLCLPAALAAPTQRRQIHIAAGLIMAACIFVISLPVMFELLGQFLQYFGLALVVGFLSVVAFNKLGPISNAGAAVAAFVALVPMTNAGFDVVERSFFGVNYVQKSADGQFRLLKHGSTIHGAVRIKDMNGNALVATRPQATTYYHDKGAINLALMAARERAGGKLGHVAVLGLGAGAMACQSQPDENWVFFEIDRKVADLAQRPELFPFLSSCTPKARIVIGDARLTFQRETVKYDVIILDAFSSDSVPAHLLTREAMVIYEQMLAPGGMIIAHVSNRYLDIQSVAEAAARASGLQSLSAHVPVDPDSMDSKLQFSTPTNAVVVARHASDFGKLATQKEWKQPRADVMNALWTDDYANILGALVREWKKSSKSQRD
jgi:spermidine synthase